jgi:DNA-binding response OmpR family regulator
MDSGVPLVVIADRDRLHEGLVTAGLTDLGYEVLNARTIWELQRLVEARHIDVLLVDLGLFGSSITFLNGVIFARRPLLVVLMLALGSGFTPDVARTSGFDACFSKIVDLKRLDRFLRDHLPLSRRPPRRQAASDAKRH